MPNPHNMEKRIREMLGEEPDTAIPRLLKTHRTPYKLAMFFGVYANSVRAWLLKNGYRYVDGAWVRAEPEPDHAA